MYEERIKKLRDIMDNKNIDSFVCYKPDNRYYLSGFSGSEGYIIMSRDKLVSRRKDGNMGEYKVDPISYQIGMINCFAEMVACGVKKMAISPPINPQDYEIINDASEKIVKGFGIKSYFTKSLIITDLQSEEFTKGKWSILYYEDQSVIDEYLNLVKEKEENVAKRLYNDIEKKEIAAKFGRLLSYPENKISEKLSKEVAPTPFVLI